MFHFTSNFYNLIQYTKNNYKKLQKKLNLFFI
ncbi:hypothetical protein BCD_1063 (plasmid) [Borrelia crocidurae DOU]|uniref:Uncharacterized protein n=1 Tax=Borrelia crocidurae DOU TaxID=1293575 RepID=W5SIZ6_9SPIR|nr:hypothetical protein BCD_1063 [Borrelia crocidurae DOU]